MGAHDAAECAGCDWERQPQAFRWFPELGPALGCGDRGAGPGEAAGQAGLIRPAALVRAVSNRAAQSAQLTTFHQALT